MNVYNGDSNFDCGDIKVNNKQEVKNKERRYMMGGWALFSYFKSSRDRENNIRKKKKKVDRENVSVGFPCNVVLVCFYAVL